MLLKRNLRNLKVLKKIARKRRLLYALLAIFAFLNLFIFLMLPSIFINSVEKKLAGKLKRKVTLNKVHINPYSFSARIEGLFIHEPDGKEIFFHCDSIFLDINIKSVLRRAPVVNELTIKRPYVNILRKDESLYNFSDLVVKKSSTGKPMRFLIGNITIEEGRIIFSDNPREKKHLVRRMNISLPFISNLPSFINTYTAPSFSAEVNGTLFVLNGKTKPFSDSLETYFDVSISKLSLPEYISYVPVPMKFKLLSAYLEGEIRLSYVQSERKESSMSVNGKLLFTDVAISGMKDNPLLKIPGIDIGISSLELFSRQAELSHIKITSPKVMLAIERKVQAEKEISPPPAAGRREKKQDTGTPPFIFKVENIAISDGRFSFADRRLDTPFDTELKSVELDIAGLSNIKDKSARFEFSAESELKETLAVSGDIKLNPFFSQGNVELGRIIVKKYAPYYGSRVSFSVGGGQGSASGGYRYVVGENKPGFSFSGISVSLKGLKADKKEGGTFLEIPLLSILKTDVDITGKKITVGSCRGEKISLRGTRGKDGKMDFLPLGPVRMGEKKPAEKSGSGKWNFSVGNMELSGSSFHLTDNSPSDPAYIAVDSFSAKIADFVPGTEKKSPFELFFLLNEKGKVAADGYFIMNPFSAAFRVDTSNLQVMPVQPYIAEKLNISVTGGSLSSEGTVSIAKPKDKKIMLVYRGDVSVKDFESVDRQYGDPFVKWGRLSLKQMSVGVNPSGTAVEEIDLQDFYANVVVHPDREMNILTAVKKQEPAADGNNRTSGREEEKQSGSTYLGKIGVENGRISFLDRSIEPNYSASIENLSGRITGISSMEKEPAFLNVAAKIGGDSNLAFKGSIRPMGRDFFLDMKVTLEGLDLTSASPYSGKYLGYTTRKGRLIFDLDYLIEKKKLKSQNRFTFDQLTLGEKVESPSATKLPVKFAIALLRDPSGKISIDLPVSGSLDDPKFRIGPVIVKMFINLIAKAAVSPFALLGAIFGGGEELSYLEYEYGTAVMQADGQKKLDTLAKILKERPALNLEIEGHVDKTEDTGALRKIIFMKKVKMQKLKETVKKGEESVPVKDIVLSPEEYERYLWLAYKNETFPRPRNIIGIVKELPVPEMEKSMLEHTEVTGDDLRLLAIARGEGAKDYLVKSGIAAERIFLLEPRLTPVEKEGTELKASRVDFRLK